ncbi:FAD-binding oxidoreductase [Stieleria sp. TO1_6]|uniref:NAD(P)/FAD-dependent oxidoreductase n=1 Tax=Stieleria tagensis TaxID=2956795 RepID=UPI00209AF7B4|nr:FAD-dependent oxidoreductase [Stieleria tagensis]MCO8123791.1 FAD-binding oxidoreductase [Stieleria tagensis]
MNTQVAIIGAGAIGLSLAYELSRRGRQVTVIERDPVDSLQHSQTQSLGKTRSATSLAAAGILPPANLDRSTDPIDRLRGLSHQLFPEWTDRLQRESGIDSELIRCGGWYLADTIGEVASMAGMVSYWNELAIECREMSLQELVRREPAMQSWSQRDGLAKAWWVPDEYQIRTPRYLDALAIACARQGVEFLDRAKVVDLDDSRGHATLTLQCERSAEQTIQVDQAVVCGGSWSGLLAERLRLCQSIVPVRGQILLLKTETAMMTSVINVGHRYFVPRRDGYVLVGSCEEEVGFQHGTTPAILHDLRSFVADTCPPLAQARQVSAWSGLRPMTFDGFPMCGKLPDSESIYVATGHFRSGIHLSPGTAVCMADLMCGQIPPLDLAAFRVGKQQSHEH